MSSLLSRITTDPEIFHAKPTIRGLRCPVEAMLENLAAGESFEDLLAQLPGLQREDLQACSEFGRPIALGQEPAPRADLNFLPDVHLNKGWS